MSVGISIREFARRDECDPALVRRAIKAGRLHRLPDGSLDESLVGSGWRRGNRIKQIAAAPIRRDENVPPIGTSIAAKTYYHAELLRMEYEGRASKVAPVAEMKKIFGAALEEVRARVMQIPGDVAAEHHLCKSVAQTEALIRRHVYAALTELSQSSRAKSNGGDVQEQA